MKMNENANTPERVSAQVVQLRLSFLPTYFCQYGYQFEAAVYTVMRDICPIYRGGMWDFCRLSNGGAYMRWDESIEKVDVRVNTNGYEGRMSPQAASIVAQLLVLSSMTFQHNGRVNGEVLIERFYQLREFACEHAEAGEILAAID